MRINIVVVVVIIFIVNIIIIIIKGKVLPDREWNCHDDHNLTLLDSEYLWTQGSLI